MWSKRNIQFRWVISIKYRYGIYASLVKYSIDLQACQRLKNWRKFIAVIYNLFMGNLVANQAINKKESGIFSKLYFGGQHQFCHNRSFIWHHWLAAENWPQLWQTKSFEVWFFGALQQIKISDFRQKKSRFSRYEEESKNWAAVLLPTSLFLKFWCGHETWSWDLKFSTLHPYCWEMNKINPVDYRHCIPVQQEIFNLNINRIKFITEYSVCTYIIPMISNISRTIITRT